MYRRPVLPRLGSSKLITTWILLTIAASFVAVIDGGWLATWASLVPSRILRGEVWRLVTWPLIEPGAISLVLTCFTIYRFGGDLAHRWGDRRLRSFILQLVLVAAVGTSLVTLLLGVDLYGRLGGLAVCDVLVIAWARQFPQQPLTLYGMVTLAGQQLVNITVATAVVFAFFYGPLSSAPELIACFAAAAYPRGLLAR